MHHSDAANTIIVETQGISTESNKSSKCSSVYNTQVEKTIVGFSIRIHSSFIIGATALRTFGSL